MTSTDGRDRGTLGSATLDACGDYITVRVTAAWPGRPKAISVAYDREHRLRRAIRRINGLP